MNISKSILIITTTMFIAACETHENQLVGGRITINGHSLQYAKVAYVHGDMSCNDESETVRIQYRTDSNGWFASYRSIHKDLIKNYFKKERLCIDRGNGWEIAWEGNIDTYPGMIQFACFGTNENPEWKCVQQCSYCNHEQTGQEIRKLLKKYPNI